ncbi:hypothetical protein SERLA73DRAFT_181644 [Serpula lacrymans var. lacrymans S7.3]|uniref:Alpha-methylacyl-CoA racemase n=2 Tax=Serpula lacrymans var. lacrymans TaxID=341189 RepID=F8PYF4_SERL3|nr:uncharacterized protein SERLADRAFT_356117 [Serpula lacrymans var. lacrymans S7.9]EGN98917.1 hypothetical protein SERLA73DRAFT_181644 [Serpula lacrymans var. lacrymans S7.3]EGO24507.1 hypothetical protein SERLADRAFT_356117 [Serpula lacrymans var. lacrymans S7.9]
MSLAGLKVIEFAGLAPAPFAGLVLADHGAEVIRIDPPSPFNNDILCRGKTSIAINLKTRSGLVVAKKLITQADILIDPFRPGVLERLGLGPEIFLGSEETKGLNDKLIFARVVGFPRAGPHKTMAGHDINYLATSGVLSMLPGTQEKPSFPLNLLADFGGGGLMCATGILLALVERGKSGKGQVVCTDMVSGTRYLSSFPLLHASESSPYFSQNRGSNILDGGAPFYDVYTCSDGRWMSVGCVEPVFFAEFIARFDKALQNEGINSSWKPSQATQTKKEDWPNLKQYLHDGFKSRPREFWEIVFHETDACVLPVLSPKEAENLDSSLYPAPHPHLSRTPSSPPLLPDGGFGKSSRLEPGAHTEQILTSLGYTIEEQKELALGGAFGQDARIEPKL